MIFEKELLARSESKCELCAATDGFAAYTPAFAPNASVENVALICETCKAQIDNESPLEPNRWRCLNESMWSTVPAVQVIAWRMLQRMRGESWPQDLLDMLYLDEDTLSWAKASGDGPADEDAVVHIDSNGVVLNSGDTVTLTKDLNVKGSSLTAKRGTSVRNIILVRDNAEQIEGRVDGQMIVILTKYVKKMA
jgi:protein PhnA